MDIEKIDMAIAEALGDAYDCTRAWSAWGYGTMHPDDFTEVREQPERITEIREAALGPVKNELAQLRTALAESQAREQLVRNALECVLEFAGTVAGSASWWDDVWSTYDGDKRMYQYDDTTLREMIEAAKAEEREACAQIGENWDCDCMPIIEEYVDAIRARKSPT